MLAALEGRPVDRLPVCPQFDRDYMIKAAGYPEVRPVGGVDSDGVWDTLDNEARGRVVAGCFARHPDVDFVFCPTGRVPAAVAPQVVPQASAAALAGLIPDPPGTPAFIDAGLYRYHEPLLAGIGREVLLGFTVNVPLGAVFDLCGGFQEGLMAMAVEPEAFGRAYLKMCAWILPRLRAGAAAGHAAVWVTQYYAGADTISPAMYRTIVQPGEQLIFDEARRLGLKTMFWFLGDLQPLVPDIMRGRPDALVLEPGRKGYAVDIGAVRAAAGGGVCLCLCPDEPAFKNGDTGRIAADIHARHRAGRGGPLAVTCPILKADTESATVDAFIRAAQGVPVR